MKKQLAIILAIALLVTLLAPVAAFAAATDSYKVDFKLVGPGKNGNDTTVTQSYSYVSSTQTLKITFAQWAFDAKTKVEDSYQGKGMHDAFMKLYWAARPDDNGRPADAKSWTEVLEPPYVVFADTTVKTLVSQWETATVGQLAAKSPVNISYLKDGTGDFDPAQDYKLTIVFTPDGSSGGAIGGGGGGATYTPTINESANGKITANPNAAGEGDKVTLTATPDDGYELDTLTVKDADGKEVALTKNDDGTYTYIQPKGKVTITGTFKEKEKEPTSTNPFVDVKEGDYFYDAAMWALQNGITTGTDATHFSPSNLCSRAETVTFLWRAEGSPEPNTTVNPFEDVDASAYYYKAVLWAAENGITYGTDATHFSPDLPTTREQFATFLYRCAKMHGKGFTGMWSFKLDFPDADDVSPWALEAMSWMVMNGVVNGMDGKLNPQGNAQRAHVVSMLYRYENLA